MRIITELTKGMTVKRKAEFFANAKEFSKEFKHCLGGLGIAFVVFVGLLLLRLYFKSLS